MGNTASDRKNARFYGLKLSRNTDADLIERLESQESIQGYLKRLIREDIEREGKTMTYHIKPEYFSLWGEETTEETIITEDELLRLSHEWEKPVSELLDQLVPID